MVFVALKIQIRIADGDIQLQGGLPASYITIEQTWGYQLRRAN